MNKNDDIKAVVGNIPIKMEKQKETKGKKKDSSIPLGWKIFVVIMAIMMFVSFAGSLIFYFVSAMGNS